MRGVAVIKSLRLIGTFLSFKGKFQTPTLVPVVRWASSNIPISNVVPVFNVASESTLLDWYVENRIKIADGLSVKKADIWSDSRLRELTLD